LFVIPAQAGIQWRQSSIVAMSPACRLRGGRFDCLPAAESLFFACSKKSNHRKGGNAKDRAPRVALAGLRPASP
jgi:hypothetical protein